MINTSSTKPRELEAIEMLYSGMGISRDPMRDYRDALEGRDVAIGGGAYYRLVQRGIEIVDSRGAVPDELVRKINSSLQ